MPKDYDKLIQKWAGTITSLELQIENGESPKGPVQEGPFLHVSKENVPAVVKRLKKKLETAKKNLKKYEDMNEKRMKGHHIESDSEGGRRRTRRHRRGATLKKYMV